VCTVGASPVDPSRGLSRCALFVHFLLPFPVRSISLCAAYKPAVAHLYRLDHCQCHARAGSVGIMNFRLGQRRRCVNMVRRSQQQRVTHGICIPAERSVTDRFRNSSVVLIRVMIPTTAAEVGWCPQVPDLAISGPGDRLPQGLIGSAP